MILRALNPQTEQDLFRLAYNFRKKRPRKNPMPFEQFAADYPNQVALGLFDPELIAVYFFHEIDEQLYQAHWTSRRDADKDAVLTGAKQLVEWFQRNGLQMAAFIHKRNIPLQRFVLAAGLKRNTCKSDTDRCNLSPNEGTTLEFRS